MTQKINLRLSHLTNLYSESLFDKIPGSLDLRIHTQRLESTKRAVPKPGPPISTITAVRLVHSELVAYKIVHCSIGCNELEALVIRTRNQKYITEGTTVALVAK